MIRKTFSVILLCLLLGGCASGEAPGEGYTFVDDLGRTVTVASHQRVAVLLGSYAQVWQLAGGQVLATADDAWEDLHLELPETTVNLGNTKNLSLEKLLSLEPDFVIASAGTRQNLEFREVLEGANIPTAYFAVNDFSDYLRLLKICTDITGRQELYAEYGTSVADRVEEIRAQAENRGTRPKVLVLRASANLLTVKGSSDNVLGEMLRDLNCVNIADSETSLLENLSLESILREDPDFIFITQRGDDWDGMVTFVEETMAAQPAWQQLTAVQSGNLYYMDKLLYNYKPNHRWAEAMEALEEILEDD